MSEPEYLERLNKDVTARQAQNKPPVPPSEPENPSEQLHAIAEEIQAQEQPAAGSEEIAHSGYFEVIPEPAIEPSEVNSGTITEDPVSEVPVIPMSELGVRESEIF